MSHIHSFTPIASAGSRVLILGSMPGVASLHAAQYYAHPRNAFWPIMGQLLGFAPAVGYRHRVAALKNSRIAVWDVLQSCIRQGSGDDSIDDESIVVNNFNAFFARHRQVERVFFNGMKAESSFRRLVLPYLERTGFRLKRLPSTSPAHASLTLAQKFEAWQAVTVG